MASLIARALQSFAEGDASTKTTPPSGLHGLVSADLLAVNATLTRQLECEEPLIQAVGEHILKAGGKRLRPSLTLASAKLCGYEGTRHIALAACVELIHTATLLHDDVVDESHLRRGLATANDVWGNKASVLVGDFLLSRSFQLMVADGSLKVLRVLSDAAATITQGEILQLATTGMPETTEADYFRVIEGKTAALFAAACEVSAIVSEREADEARLRRFGLLLGNAFQIVDDALDYSARESTLGKKVGDDFREGKITLPIIFAWQRGTEAERAFWRRTLQDQEQHEGDLAEAMQLMERHHALTDSLARARALAEEAKAQLAPFAESAAKEALHALADSSVARSF